MPEITDDQPKAATPESSRPASALNPPPEGAGDMAPLSPGAALFRAFLRAGCDAELAYAAVEEVKMMAGENAAEHLTRLERLVIQHAK